MIHLMFSVYDRVSGLYSKPFYSMSENTAIRDFRTAARDDQSDIGKNPSDYSLHYVGSFDDQTGRVVGLENPKHVYAIQFEG